mmetsp:Transcript_26271/g.55355  ORF Transcript_26271/g.55355 Transcript_26271/m.55355 type:complete len:437 (+) Transcript_26271:339-1649(+)
MTGIAIDRCRRRRSFVDVNFRQFVGSRGGHSAGIVGRRRRRSGGRRGRSGRGGVALGYVSIGRGLVTGIVDDERRKHDGFGAEALENGSFSLHHDFQLVDGGDGVVWFRRWLHVHGIPIAGRHLLQEGIPDGPRHDRLFGRRADDPGIHGVENGGQGDSGRRGAAAGRRQLGAVDGQLGLIPGHFEDGPGFVHVPLATGRSAAGGSAAGGSARAAALSLQQLHEHLDQPHQKVHGGGRVEHPPQRAQNAQLHLLEHLGAVRVARHEAEFLEGQDALSRAPGAVARRVGGDGVLLHVAVQLARQVQTGQRHEVRHHAGQDRRLRLPRRRLLPAQPGVALGQVAIEVVHAPEDDFAVEAEVVDAVVVPLADGAAELRVGCGCGRVVVVDVDVVSRTIMRGILLFLGEQRGQLLLQGQKREFLDCFPAHDDNDDGFYCY